MEWQKLDLAKASLLKKEVDAVLSRLAEISSSPGGDLDKSALVNTVQARIQELETFYLKNSDDERAILFEKERLRLRKALQPFYGGSSKDNRSLTASEVYDRSAHESTVSKVGDRLSASQLSRSSRAVQQVSSTRSVTSLQSAGQQMKSPTMAASRSFRSPVSPGRIYNWEDGSVKSARHNVEINGICFEPTQVAGFYNRRMTREEAEDLVSDKYIDVQIVLTQEELTTLAARKKVDRQDTKLFKSQAAATSVHSSVPYVDPRRIRQDMLRPGHPDRWLGMQGFTH